MGVGSNPRTMTGATGGGATDGLSPATESEQKKKKKKNSQVHLDFN